MKKATNDSHLVLITTLIAIIPLLVLCFILTFIFTTSEYDQNIQTLNNSAGTVAIYLKDTYNVSIEGLNDLSHTESYVSLLKNPNDTEARAQAESIMETGNTANPQIITSLLVSTDGNVLLSKSKVSSLGLNIVDTSVFKRLMQGDEVASQIEFEDDQPYMRVGIRIYDSDGNFVGIFTRILSLPMIRSMALQVNENGNCMILIGEDGESLQYLPYDNYYYGYLQNNSEASDEETIKDIEHQLDVLKDDESNGYFNYDAEDKQFLATFAEVEDLGWTVIVSEPKAMLMYDINRFQLITLGLTLIVVIIVVIVTQFLAKRYANSYENLENTLQSYLREDYSQRCQKSTLGQVNRLGTLINSVGDLFQDKEREVRFFQKKIYENQNMDQNTRLMSRSAIYTKIAQHFGHSENQALILLNISGYKELTSLYGQAFGMKIIEQAARILRRLKREHSYIARLGDDDFLIFISDFTGEEQVLEYVQQIIQELDGIKDVDGQQVSIEAYAGIVYLDESITSRTVWMKQADMANSLARKSQKKYYIYDDPSDSYQRKDSMSEREAKAQQNMINDFLLRDHSDFFIAGDSREDLSKKSNSKDETKTDTDAKEDPQKDDDSSSDSEA